MTGEGMNRVLHTFSSACQTEDPFLEALVLGRKELGEADLMVVLLTRDQGKIRVLAKSARKSVKRFPFRLDLFIHIEVAIRERKELPLLQEALLLSPFLRLREELLSYAMASLAAEMASILSPERMPAQESFFSRPSRPAFFPWQASGRRWYPALHAGSL